jgi:cell division protein FtsZ
MGTGTATGADAAEEAANMAISSPLLDDVSIKGASGILVNVTGSKALGIKQISKAASIINSEAGPGAHVFLGAVINEDLPDDEIRITVIATGFSRAGRAAGRHDEETGRKREDRAARVLDSRPPTVVEMAPRRPQQERAPRGTDEHREVQQVHEEPPAPDPEPRESAAPAARAGRASQSEEIDFSELLEGDRRVIEIDLERDVDDVGEGEDDDSVIMDNGSIRSFNTDNFRTPTFVRKQID